MYLKQHLSLIWRWLWLILGCALLAAIVAFAVTKSIAPTYASTTTLLVSLDSLATTASQRYDALAASQILVKKYADIITTRPVLDTVIGKLKLNTSAEELAQDVHVSTNVNAQTIKLTVEDTNIQRAPAIANEIANVFIENLRIQQQQRYTETKSDLDQQIQNMQTEIARTQAAIDTSKAANATNEQHQLEVQLAQYQNSYEELLNARTTLDRTASMGAGGLQVIEMASPNATPIRPRIWINTGLAALVAALIAGVVALLIETFDDTLKSPESVKMRLDLPYLASIVKDARVANTKHPLALVDAHAPVTDDFRRLRTSIDLLSQQSPIHTIAVASANPHDGTSTIVANLGVAYAQAGKKVILVDANIRRPNLHSFFNLSNENGLTMALHQAGNTPIQHYLVETRLPNLQLLPSGTQLSTATDMIASEHMATLVTKLKEQADLVLFDSPPFRIASDALVLAQYCDGILLVAQEGKSSAAALQQYKEQLTQAHVRVLGIVLNMVKSGSRLPWQQ